MKASYAFVESIQSRSSTSSHLSMNLFGGITKSDESLPRDVKDAVSRCRVATQEALKNRISRMEVEFPVGTRFSVEPSAKSKKTMDGGPTMEKLDQSDRELARVFVEMFQPVGGDNIVVAFREQDLADMAKKKWKGDSGALSRIMAMNRRKRGSGAKQNKVNKPQGFAAKMAAEINDASDFGGGPFELPKNTEVALFVAPGPKELVIIEKICNEFGMGTLVILLNARLSKVKNFGTDAAAKLFTDAFEPVFCLSAASQDVAPDCLLFRAYPGDWVMARKPKVGQPKPLLTQSSKPTIVECRQAYESLELGDVEKGIETALENVAGWFR